MIRRQRFFTTRRVSEGSYAAGAVPRSRFGLGLRQQATTLRVITTRRVCEGLFAAGPVPRSRVGLGLKQQATTLRVRMAGFIRRSTCEIVFTLRQIDLYSR